MWTNQNFLRQGTKATRARNSAWPGMLLSLVVWVSLGAPVWGAPSEPPVTNDPTPAMIREAAMAADRAWEEFHEAAIGGTLASPHLQATIEVQLHEMRKLLMEARQAERNQRHESARQLTREILHITNHIIQASRERKS
jgi:hypothetical protein